MEKSLGRHYPLSPPPIPTPPGSSQIRQRALRPPRTVCIIGICPVLFRGAGHQKWTFLSGQPSDDCSITSRVKGRGQMRSGVLWKVQESQVSPLGCSPPVLDAAQLARTSTSSAQLIHMDCAMQLAALAAGCVRAQHALGSGVPRCSMHGCAHTAHVHVRATRAHNPCFTPIWMNTVNELSSLGFRRK